MASDPLLRRISGPTTGLLVFAFPGAGSGPSVFRQWLPHRPPGLELVAIHTPGREDRWLDSPVSSVTPLADDIAAAIDDYGDRPFVFFGHSAGALLGREVAWRLRQRDRPLRLFVTGAAATPDVPVYTLAKADDGVLIQAMREWGGIPEEMLDNEDVLDVILPCLRADMALADDCRCDHPPTTDDLIDVPIIALAGADDEAIHFPDCERWATWTTAPTVAHRLPGGHFFPFGQAPAVFEFLKADPDRLGERIDPGQFSPLAPLAPRPTH